MADFLDHPTPFLFFTGKGGVGKTSVSSATALHLVECGKRVLLVSTDPASNLDTVLGTPLTSEPTAIAQYPGLSALNLDPDTTTAAYRDRLMAQYQAALPADAFADMKDRLAGACTVEIASYDAFIRLMDLMTTSDAWDHLVFDTAPTGHTLRLLELPQAWSSYIDGTVHTPTYVGPVTGLRNEQARNEQTVQLLHDPKMTTMILVARPDPASLREAERTRTKLNELGLTHQQLLINGVFMSSDSGDPLASRLSDNARDALQDLPAGLAGLAQRRVPLKPHNVIGREALEHFFEPVPPGVPSVDPEKPQARDDIGELVDKLVAEQRGLVMVMGKGGVGKTTMAAALAVAVARRGAKVHLTTTDPAAHLSTTLTDQVENLRVTRVDPDEALESYRSKVLERARKKLSPEAFDVMREDLLSPCNHEVAVFHAFSQVVFSAAREVVIMDTAPTGHTMLLLDTTGTYHREMQQAATSQVMNVRTPLMQLRDPELTRILIVALPETTPVEEAAALQEDLREAEIEPYGWIMNRSLVGSATRDPVLLARAHMEAREITHVAADLASRLYVVPLAVEPPVGALALSALLED